MHFLSCIHRFTRRKSKSRRIDSRRGSWYWAVVVRLLSFLRSFYIQRGFFSSCPTHCALVGRRNLGLAACTIRCLILVSFVMGPHIFLYAAIDCTFSTSMLLASRSLAFPVIACDDTSNCNAHTQIIQSHSMGYWLSANTKYRGRAPQVVHSDHNFLSV